MLPWALRTLGFANGPISSPRIDPISINANSGRLSSMPAPYWSSGRVAGEALYSSERIGSYREAAWAIEGAAAPVRAITHRRGVNPPNCHLINSVGQPTPQHAATHIDAPLGRLPGTHRARNRRTGRPWCSVLEEHTGTPVSIEAGQLMQVSAGPNRLGLLGEVEIKLDQISNAWRLPVQP